MKLQMLAVSSSGELAMETVFMFSHQDYNTVAVYLQFRLANNASLLVTPGHYLWVCHRSGTFAEAAAIIPARNIKEGDHIWAVATGDPVPTRVLEVQVIEEQGLFNPHTKSGGLIVNGVATLAFTERLPPSTAWHTITTFPAKAFFHALPLRWAAAVNAYILKSFQSGEIVP